MPRPLDQSQRLWPQGKGLTSQAAAITFKWKFLVLLRFHTGQSRSVSVRFWAKNCDFGFGSVFWSWAGGIGNKGCSRSSTARFRAAQFRAVQYRAERFSAAAWSRARRLRRWNVWFVSSVNTRPLKSFAKAACRCSKPCWVGIPSRPMD